MKIVEMAEFMHQLLIINKLIIELGYLNLSHFFNSCNITIYHSLNDIKEESGTG